MRKKCVYGNHIIDTNDVSLFCYTDKPNDVEDNTATCEECYLKHLQKFYPGSYVTQRLTEMEADA